MNVHNISLDVIRLESGQKILQFIMLKHPKVKLIEVEDESILYIDKVSERGEGMLGSTDKGK